MNKVDRDLFPGALEMMILRTLKRQPLHGYALAQHIKRTSDDLLQIEEGSLYPALQRLLKAELVKDFGVSERNVTVIPFGINNSVPNTTVMTSEEAKRRLGIQDGDKTILFFGRIRGDVDPGRHPGGGQPDGARGCRAGAAGDARRPRRRGDRVAVVGALRAPRHRQQTGRRNDRAPSQGPMTAPAHDVNLCNTVRRAYQLQRLRWSAVVRSAMSGVCPGVNPAALRGSDARHSAWHAGTRRIAMRR